MEEYGKLEFVIRNSDFAVKGGANDTYIRMHN